MISAGIVCVCEDVVIKITKSTIIQCHNKNFTNHPNLADVSIAWSYNRCYSNWLFCEYIVGLILRFVFKIISYYKFLPLQGGRHVSEFVVGEVVGVKS